MIARELKKKLVEQNRLEVTQQEVEKTLFNLIVDIFEAPVWTYLIRERTITQRITSKGTKWFQSKCFFENSSKNTLY